MDISRTIPVTVEYCRHAPAPLAFDHPQRVRHLGSDRVTPSDQHLTPLQFLRSRSHPVRRPPRPSLLVSARVVDQIRRPDWRRGTRASVLIHRRATACRSRNRSQKLLEIPVRTSMASDKRAHRHLPFGSRRQVAQHDAALASPLQSPAIIDDIAPADRPVDDLDERGLETPRSSLGVQDAEHRIGIDEIRSPHPVQQSPVLRLQPITTRSEEDMQLVLRARRSSRGSRS